MDLPEPPKGPFRYSDISSFEDLYQSATRIGEHCVALVRQAGYQDTGKIQRSFFKPDAWGVVILKAIIRHLRESRRLPYGN